MKLSDDGSITFVDASGQPLSENLVKRAKSQNGDKIREFIQNKCDEINETADSLARLHLNTPKPDQRLRYERRRFDLDAPIEPRLKTHGILGRLFRSVRDRIDRANMEATAAYQSALEELRKRKSSFDLEEREREDLLERRVLNDVDGMELVLEGALKSLAWPQETNVSAEVDEGGQLVLLDLDLPEIESLPTKIAAYSGKSFKPSIKDMSEVQRQKLYREHIHSIGFRIIGEVFAVLPKSFNVILSAYSQRPSRETGRIGDEYLYSVRVGRPKWVEIDFGNLDEIDVVSALERFELRRDMTKTGVFRPIEPIQP